MRMTLNIDMKTFQLVLTFLFSTTLAFAAPPLSTEETEKSWMKNIGLSYFSFFDGPGLAPGSSTFTPNVLGKPMDDGLRLSNYLSLKYSLSQDLAVDFQARIQCILNNSSQVSPFSALRWQAPRIGISGKLLSGRTWSLSGAINSDLPYFFPQPFGGGVAAQQRTTLFNPGLFAKFSYTPPGSPWSIFSLVMPRIFFYSNRNVAEPQLSRAGFSPSLKNEFILDIAPSINYSLSPATGLRFGTEFIYSKLILSDWNPFHVTLNNTDLSSTAWRLAPIPIQLGVTHEFSSMLNVSVFLQGFPIAAQRIRRDGTQSDFVHTSSIGMWISGTLL